MVLPWACIGCSGWAKNCEEIEYNKVKPFTSVHMYVCNVMYVCMYYSVVYMNVQVGLFFVAVAVLQLQLQWSAGPPGGLVPRSPEYKFYKKK